MQRFRVATTIHHGPQSLALLGKYRGRRVLVVTDAFMATTPVADAVRAALGDAEVTIFDRVEPNPSIALVAEGMKVFLAAQPEVVVALGGGSPIDTAKAVYKVALEQGSTDALELVVVPTTSGTGSEVTSFAVVTDTANNTKIPLSSEDMLPDIAILDPDAVRSAPAKVTADTGMDAASHAIEAYVAKHHSDFSDALAEKALQLVFTYLERACRDGTDMASREHLHNASCLAGLAFENAGLGIVHSLSHALGAIFPVTHGRLNSLVMPHVLTFNAGQIGYGPANLSEVAKRYAQLGRLIGVRASSERNLAIGFFTEVKRLTRALGMPVKASDAGIPTNELLAAIPDLARTALDDFCTSGNPVEVTSADLEKLLRKLL